MKESINNASRIPRYCGTDSSTSVQSSKPDSLQCGKRSRSLAMVSREENNTQHMRRTRSSGEMSRTKSTLQNACEPRVLTPLQNPKVTQFNESQGFSDHDTNSLSSQHWESIEVRYLPCSTHMHSSGSQAAGVSSLALPPKVPEIEQRKTGVRVDKDRMSLIKSQGDCCDQIDKLSASDPMCRSTQMCKQTVRVERLEVVNLLEQPRQLYGDLKSMRKSQYSPRMLPLKALNHGSPTLLAIPTASLPSHDISNSSPRNGLSRSSSNSPSCSRTQSMRNNPALSINRYYDDMFTAGYLSDEKELGSLYDHGPNGCDSLIGKDRCAPEEYVGFNECSDDNPMGSQRNVACNDQHYLPPSGGIEHDNFSYTYDEKTIPDCLEMETNYEEHRGGMMKYSLPSSDCLLFPLDELPSSLDISYTLSSSQSEKPKKISSQPKVHTPTNKTKSMATQEIGCTTNTKVPAQKKEDSISSKKVNHVSPDVLNEYKRMAIEILMERKLENSNKNPSKELPKGVSIPPSRNPSSTPVSNAVLSLPKYPRTVGNPREQQTLRKKMETMRLNHLSSLQRSRSFSTWPDQSICSLTSSNTQSGKQSLDEYQGTQFQAASMDTTPVNLVGRGGNPRADYRQFVNVESTNSQGDTRDNNPYTSVMNSDAEKNRILSTIQLETLLHDIIRSPSAKATQALGLFYKTLESCNSIGAVNVPMEDVDMSVDEILNEYNILFNGQHKPPTHEDEAEQSRLEHSPNHRRDRDMHAELKKKLDGNEVTDDPSSEWGNGTCSQGDVSIEDCDHVNKAHGKLAIVQDKGGISNQKQGSVDNCVTSEHSPWMSSCVSSDSKVSQKSPSKSSSVLQLCKASQPTLHTSTLDSESLKESTSKQASKAGALQAELLRYSNRYDNDMLHQEERSVDGQYLIHEISEQNPYYLTHELKVPETSELDIHSPNSSTSLFGNWDVVSFLKEAREKEVSYQKESYSKLHHQEQRRKLQLGNSQQNLKTKECGSSSGGIRSKMLNKSVPRRKSAESIGSNDFHGRAGFGTRGRNYSLPRRRSTESIGSHDGFFSGGLGTHKRNHSVPRRPSSESIATSDEYRSLDFGIQARKTSAPRRASRERVSSSDGSGCVVTQRTPKTTFKDDGKNTTVNRELKSGNSGKERDISFTEQQQLVNSRKRCSSNGRLYGQVQRNDSPLAASKLKKRHKGGDLKQSESPKPAMTSISGSSIPGRRVQGDTDKRRAKGVPSTTKEQSKVDKKVSRRSQQFHEMRDQLYETIRDKLSERPTRHGNAISKGLHSGIAASKVANERGKDHKIQILAKPSIKSPREYKEEMYNSIPIMQNIEQRRAESPIQQSEALKNFHLLDTSLSSKSRVNFKNVLNAYFNLKKSPNKAASSQKEDHLESLVSPPLLNHSLSKSFSTSDVNTRYSSTNAEETKYTSERGSTKAQPSARSCNSSESLRQSSIMLEKSIGDMTSSDDMMRSVRGRIVDRTCLMILEEARKRGTESIPTDLETESVPINCESDLIQSSLPDVEGSHSGNVKNSCPDMKSSNETEPEIDGKLSDAPPCSKNEYTLDFRNGRHANQDNENKERRGQIANSAGKHPKQTKCHPMNNIRKINRKSSKEKLTDGKQYTTPSDQDRNKKMPAHDFSDPLCPWDTCGELVSAGILHDDGEVDDYVRESKGASLPLATHATGEYMNADFNKFKYSIHSHYDGFIADVYYLNSDLIFLLKTTNNRMLSFALQNPYLRWLKEVKISFRNLAAVYPYSTPLGGHPPRLRTGYCDTALFLQRHASMISLSLENSSLHSLETSVSKTTQPNQTDAFCIGVNSSQLKNKHCFTFSSPVNDENSAVSSEGTNESVLLDINTDDYNRFDPSPHEEILFTAPFLSESQAFQVYLPPDLMFLTPMFSALGGVNLIGLQFNSGPSCYQEYCYEGDMADNMAQEMYQDGEADVPTIYNDLMLSDASLLISEVDNSSPFTPSVIIEPSDRTEMFETTPTDGSETNVPIPQVSSQQQRSSRNYLGLGPLNPSFCEPPAITMFPHSLLSTSNGDGGSENSEHKNSLRKTPAVKKLSSTIVTEEDLEEGNNDDERSYQKMNTNLILNYSNIIASTDGYSADGDDDDDDDEGDDDDDDSDVKKSTISENKGKSDKNTLANDNCNDYTDAKNSLRNDEETSAPIFGSMEIYFEGVNEILAASNGRGTEMDKSSTINDANLSLENQPHEAKQYGAGNETSNKLFSDQPCNQIASPDCVLEETLREKSHNECERLITIDQETTANSTEVRSPTGFDDSRPNNRPLLTENLVQNGGAVKSSSDNEIMQMRSSVAGSSARTSKLSLGNRCRDNKPLLYLGSGRHRPGHMPYRRMHEECSQLKNSFCSMVGRDKPGLDVIRSSTIQALSEFLESLSDEALDQSMDTSHQFSDAVSVSCHFDGPSDKTQLPCKKKSFTNNASAPQEVLDTQSLKSKINSVSKPVNMANLITSKKEEPIRIDGEYIDNPEAARIKKMMSKLIPLCSRSSNDSRSVNDLSGADQNTYTPKAQGAALGQILGDKISSKQSERVRQDSTAVLPENIRRNIPGVDDLIGLIRRTLAADIKEINEDEALPIEKEVIVSISPPVTSVGVGDQTHWNQLKEVVYTEHGDYNAHTRPLVKPTEEDANNVEPFTCRPCLYTHENGTLDSRRRQKGRSNMLDTKRIGKVPSSSSSNDSKRKERRSNVLGNINSKAKGIFRHSYEKTDCAGIQGNEEAIDDSVVVQSNFEPRQITYKSTAKKKVTFVPSRTTTTTATTKRKQQNECERSTSDSVLPRSTEHNESVRDSTSLLRKTSQLSDFTSCTLKDKRDHFREILEKTRDQLLSSTRTTPSDEGIEKEKSRHKRILRDPTPLLGHISRKKHYSRDHVSRCPTNVSREVDRQTEQSSLPPQSIKRRFREHPIGENCKHCVKELNQVAGSKRSLHKKNSNTRSGAGSCSDTFGDLGSFETECIVSDEENSSMESQWLGLSTKDEDDDEDDLSTSKLNDIDQEQGLQTMLASCLVAALENVLKKCYVPKNHPPVSNAQQPHRNKSIPSISQKSMEKRGEDMQTSVKRHLQRTRQVMSPPHPSVIGCDTNTLAQVSPLPTDYIMGETNAATTNEDEDLKLKVGNGRYYVIDAFTSMVLNDVNCENKVRLKKENSDQCRKWTKKRKTASFSQKRSKDNSTNDSIVGSSANFPRASTFIDGSTTTETELRFCKRPNVVTLRDHRSNGMFTKGNSGGRQDSISRHQRTYSEQNQLTSLGFCQRTPTTPSGNDIISGLTNESVSCDAYDNISPGLSDEDSLLLKDSHDSSDDNFETGGRIRDCRVLRNVVDSDDDVTFVNGRMLRKALISSGATYESNHKSGYKPSSTSRKTFVSASPSPLMPKSIGSTPAVRRRSSLPRRFGRWVEEESLDEDNFDSPDKVRYMDDRPYFHRGNNVVAKTQSMTSTTFVPETAETDGEPLELSGMPLGAAIVSSYRDQPSRRTVNSSEMKTLKGLPESSRKRISNLIERNRLQQGAENRYSMEYDGVNIRRHDSSLHRSINFSDGGPHTKLVIRVPRVRNDSVSPSYSDNRIKPATQEFTNEMVDSSPINHGSDNDDGNDDNDNTYTLDDFNSRKCKADRVSSKIEDAFDKFILAEVRESDGRRMFDIINSPDDVDDDDDADNDDGNDDEEDDEKKSDISSTNGTFFIVNRADVNKVIHEEPLAVSNAASGLSTINNKSDGSGEGRTMTTVVHNDGGNDSPAWLNTEIIGAAASKGEKGEIDVHHDGDLSMNNDSSTDDTIHVLQMKSNGECNLSCYEDWSELDGDEDDERLFINTLHMSGQTMLDLPLITVGGGEDVMIIKEVDGVIRTLNTLVIEPVCHDIITTPVTAVNDNTLMLRNTDTLIEKIEIPPNDKDLHIVNNEESCENIKQPMENDCIILEDKAASLKSLDFLQTSGLLALNDNEPVPEKGSFPCIRYGLQLQPTHITLIPQSDEIIANKGLPLADDGLRPSNDETISEVIGSGIVPSYPNIASNKLDEDAPILNNDVMLPVDADTISNPSLRAKPQEQDLSLEVGVNNHTTHPMKTVMTQSETVGVMKHESTILVSLEDSDYSPISLNADLSVISSSSSSSSSIIRLSLSSSPEVHNVPNIRGDNVRALPFDSSESDVSINQTSPKMNVNITSFDDQREENIATTQTNILPPSGRAEFTIMYCNQESPMDHDLEIYNVDGLQQLREIKEHQMEMIGESANIELNIDSSSPHCPCSAQPAEEKELIDAESTKPLSETLGSENDVTPKHCCSEDNHIDKNISEGVAINDYKLVPCEINSQVINENLPITETELLYKTDCHHQNIDTKELSQNECDVAEVKISESISYQHVVSASITSKDPVLFSTPLTNNDRKQIETTTAARLDRQHLISMCQTTGLQSERDSLINLSLRSSLRTFTSDKEDCDRAVATPGPSLEPNAESDATGTDNEYDDLDVVNNEMGGDIINNIDCQNGGYLMATAAFEDDIMAKTVNIDLELDHPISNDRVLMAADVFEDDIMAKSVNTELELDHPISNDRILMATGAFADEMKEGIQDGDRDGSGITEKSLNIDLEATDPVDQDNLEANDDTPLVPRIDIRIEEDVSITGNDDCKDITEKEMIKLTHNGNIADPILRENDYSLLNGVEKMDAENDWQCVSDDNDNDTSLSRKESNTIEQEVKYEAEDPQCHLTVSTENSTSTAPEEDAIIVVNTVEKNDVTESEAVEIYHQEEDGGDILEGDHEDPMVKMIREDEPECNECNLIMDEETTELAKLKDTEFMPMVGSVPVCNNDDTSYASDHTCKQYQENVESIQALTNAEIVSIIRSEVEESEPNDSIISKGNNDFQDYQNAIIKSHSSNTQVEKDDDLVDNKDNINTPLEYNSVETYGKINSSFDTNQAENKDQVSTHFEYNQVENKDQVSTHFEYNKVENKDQVSTHFEYNQVENKDKINIHFESKQVENKDKIDPSYESKQIENKDKINTSSESIQVENKDKINTLSKSNQVENKDKINTLSQSNQFENKDKIDPSYESKQVENKDKINTLYESNQAENKVKIDPSYESKQVENKDKINTSSESKQVENKDKINTLSESNQFENKDKMDHSYESKQIENKDKINTSSESNPVQNKDKSNIPSESKQVETHSLIKTKFDSTCIENNIDRSTNPTVNDFESHILASTAMRANLPKAFSISRNEHDDPLPKKSVSSIDASLDDIILANMGVISSKSCISPLMKDIMISASFNTTHRPVDNKSQTTKYNSDAIYSANSISSDDVTIIDNGGYEGDDDDNVDDDGGSDDDEYDDDNEGVHDDIGWTRLPIPCGTEPASVKTDSTTTNTLSDNSLAFFGCTEDTTGPTDSESTITTIEQRDVSNQISSRSSLYKGEKETAEEPANEKVSISEFCGDTAVNVIMKMIDDDDSTSKDYGETLLDFSEFCGDTAVDALMKIKEDDGENCITSDHSATGIVNSSYPESTNSQTSFSIATSKIYEILAELCMSTVDECTNLDLDPCSSHDEILSDMIVEINECLDGLDISASENQLPIGEEALDIPLLDKIEMETPSELSEMNHTLSLHVRDNHSFQNPLKELPNLVDEELNSTDGVTEAQESNSEQGKEYNIQNEELSSELAPKTENEFNASEISLTQPERDQNLNPSEHPKANAFMMGNSYEVHELEILHEDKELSEKTIEASEIIPSPCSQQLSETRPISIDINNPEPLLNAELGLKENVLDNLDKSECDDVDPSLNKTFENQGDIVDIKNDNEREDIHSIDEVGAESIDFPDASEKQATDILDNVEYQDNQTCHITLLIQVRKSEYKVEHQEIEEDDSVRSVRLAEARLKRSALDESLKSQEAPETYLIEINKSIPESIRATTVHADGNVSNETMDKQILPEYPNIEIESVNILNPHEINMVHGEGDTIIDHIFEPVLGRYDSIEEVDTQESESSVLQRLSVDEVKPVIELALHETHTCCRDQNALDVDHQMASSTNGGSHASVTETRKKDELRGFPVPKIKSNDSIDEIDRCLSYAEKDDTVVSECVNDSEKYRTQCDEVKMVGSHDTIIGAKHSTEERTISSETSNTNLSQNRKHDPVDSISYSPQNETPQITKNYVPETQLILCGEEMVGDVHCSGVNIPSENAIPNTHDINGSKAEKELEMNFTHENTPIITENVQTLISIGDKHQMELLCGTPFDDQPVELCNKSLTDTHDILDPIETNSKLDHIDTIAQHINSDDDLHSISEEKQDPDLLESSENQFNIDKCAMKTNDNNITMQEQETILSPDSTSHKFSDAEEDVAQNTSYSESEIMSQAFEIVSAALKMAIKIYEANQPMKMAAVLTNETATSSVETRDTTLVLRGDSCGHTEDGANTIVKTKPNYTSCQYSNVVNIEEDAHSSHLYAKLPDRAEPEIKSSSQNSKCEKHYHSDSRVNSDREFENANCELLLHEHQLVKSNLMKINSRELTSKDLHLSQDGSSINQFTNELGFDHQMSKNDASHSHQSMIDNAEFSRNSELIEGKCRLNPVSTMYSKCQGSKIVNPPLRMKNPPDPRRRCLCESYPGELLPVSQSHWTIPSPQAFYRDASGALPPYPPSRSQRNQHDPLFQSSALHHNDPSASTNYHDKDVGITANTKDYPWNNNSRNRTARRTAHIHRSNDVKTKWIKGQERINNCTVNGSKIVSSCKEIINPSRNAPADEVILRRPYSTDKIQGKRDKSECSIDNMTSLQGRITHHNVRPSQAFHKRKKAKYKRVDWRVIKPRMGFYYRHHSFYVANIGRFDSSGTLKDLTSAPDEGKEGSKQKLKSSSFLQHQHNSRADTMGQGLDMTKLDSQRNHTILNVNRDTYSNQFSHDCPDVQISNDKPIINEMKTTMNDRSGRLLAHVDKSKEAGDVIGSQVCKLDYKLSNNKDEFQETHQRNVLPCKCKTVDKPADKRVREASLEEESQRHIVKPTHINRIQEKCNNEGDNNECFYSKGPVDQTAPKTSQQLLVLAVDSLQNALQKPPTNKSRINYPDLQGNPLTARREKEYSDDVYPLLNIPSMSEDRRHTIHDKTSAVDDHQYSSRRKRLDSGGCIEALKAKQGQSCPVQVTKGTPMDIVREFLDSQSQVKLAKTTVENKYYPSNSQTTARSNKESPCKTLSGQTPSVAISGSLMNPRVPMYHHDSHSTPFTFSNTVVCEVDANILLKDACSSQKQRDRTSKRKRCASSVSEQCSSSTQPTVESTTRRARSSGNSPKRNCTKQQGNDHIIGVTSPPKDLSIVSKAVQLPETGQTTYLPKGKPPLIDHHRVESIKQQSYHLVVNTSSSSSLKRWKDRMKKVLRISTNNK